MKPARRKPGGLFARDAQQRVRSAHKCCAQHEKYARKRAEIDQKLSQMI